CKLTGSKDSNGYAFEGTLVCTGMRENGQGSADYRLGAAVTLGEPIKLQIVHCN
ncbi:MAG: hypothetical protein JWN04_6074, partial [Myxococcaceae bacterium]|nr:hypothetical protein [Myxococcaceae bacterium]